MRYPPGVSTADFDTAVTEFQTAIGSDWVFTDEADVDLYRDAYSPFWQEDSEKLPSIALAPQSTEEVQAIMRICNRYRIPIYPVSTGRNLGYGGSAPVLNGSVVLDLKRMNRILEVNERNAFALVEPGVSYFELYRHIQERGLKLWIDCPDPGWGSLVGNALDHGAGFTVNPYRDHFDAHCGMEVVLADGDVLRTGMGALPGAQTWQQFKHGYGPGVDGLFGQSNFGVVTKMGFWLYPQPEAYRSGTILVPRHNDIIPLVDITARLMNSGIMNAGTGLNSPMRFAANGNPQLRELFERTDPAGIAALNEFAVSNNIPFWSSQLRFYGPPEIIDASWEYAKRQFAGIDGVQYREDEYFNFPLSAEEIERSADENQFGIPSLSVFSIGARSAFNPEPSQGHLWFSPVIPFTGEAIIESQRVLAQAFRDMGLAPVSNVFPQSYHPRTLVILLGFPITHDVEANRKNRETFRTLIRIAGEHGWGEYRTHTAFMDDCRATYSYNDNALLRFQEALKDAVDPNGIISAGRYGIWPRHLREEQG
jgi:4-cresol dehydrogenase (hydroxylating)